MPYIRGKLSLWNCAKLNRPSCPPCGSPRTIKFGLARGKQRWRCRACRYQFTQPAVARPKPEAQQAAVTLYSHGLSLRSIGRLLGTTAQSVLRWVCRYVDARCPKPRPIPGQAVVVELDEMWHYLQRKTDKLWIWKAVDRATGRLIDWECGDRSASTARPLIERLTAWSVRLFCTDSYAAYETLLQVGQHYQGKDQTLRVERDNGRQRHWLANFRRRSIVVSKSKAMVERRIALYAHFHPNGDADPGMGRLPLLSQPT
jgi:insertion element IS1 protein InsB